MAIRLSFEGFAGTPEELQRALRSGRVEPRELPLLELIDQALSQVAALELYQRGALLPLLAELLERKLRALLRTDATADEEVEEDEGEALVGLLVELDEVVRFLMERAQARRDVWPIPAAALPRDGRIAPVSVASLYRQARRFLRPTALLPAVERLGVAETWAWLQDHLRKVRSTWFSNLGIQTWPERTVAFAALLEAVRNGRVRLDQKSPYADLHIELESETEEQSA